MKQCSAEAGALVSVWVHGSGNVQPWMCPFACPRLLSFLADSPFLGPCLRAEFLLVPQMHHILSWISDFMHFLKCLPPRQFSWNTEDPITIGAIISGGPFPQHPAALAPNSLSCFSLYAPVVLTFVAAVNTMNCSLSAYLSFLLLVVSYSNLRTMSYLHLLLTILSLHSDHSNG